MGKTYELTASLEDYLEVIFHLEQRNKVARTNEIAREMNVKMSSVTTAIKHLADDGLVNYEPYHFITLTPSGRTLAQRLVRRHDVLATFFREVLSCPEPEADQTACRVEHAINPEMLERFVNFIEFVEHCPRSGPDWIAGFREFCSSGEQQECEQCFREAMRRRLDTEPSTPAKGTKGNPHE